jgi:hypothetical protein
MIDNKYFNSSRDTQGGKPKFLPPQKRQDQVELPTQQEEKPVDVKPRFESKQIFEPRQQNNNFKPLFARFLSIYSGLYFRNCVPYSTSWGYRHLRRGYLEKEMEKEELDLFEEQRRQTSKVSEGVESYDDLQVEITNKTKETLPEPEDSFENLKLQPSLYENIKKCGYERLTIIQRNAVPVMMKKLNIMAASQTGSGKTASFLLPIINNLLETGPPNPDASIDEYKKCKST